METAEDFTTLVKTLMKLTIADHKQKKLPKSPTDPLPNFLAAAEEYIIRIIQPYLPSEMTNLCAHNNAKNWTTATLDTLKEHYDRIKEEAIDTIQTLLVPDWERAFLVASRWTKRTNENIDPSSLQMTHAILTKIMSLSFPPTNMTRHMNQHQTEEDNGKPRGTHTNVRNTRHQNRDSTPTEEGQTNHTTYQEELEMTQPEYTQEDLNTPQPLKRKRCTPPPTRTQTPTSNPRFPEDDHNVYVQAKRLKTLPLNTYPEDEEEPPTNMNLEEEDTDEDSTPTKDDATTNQNHPDTARSIRQVQLTTTHTELAKWYLLPRRPMLIQGDGNITKLPPITDFRVQVNSYPGAKISHATYLLKNKTATTAQVTTVILSFGFEDRHTSNPSLIIKPIGALLNAARNTFPNAKIYIPLINYSSNLPPQTQKNIAQINEVIKSRNSFIPRLEKNNFVTLPDNVRWTDNTGMNMWRHWKSFLG